MENISVSRMKTFHGCKLAYNYTYVDKFIKVDDTPADVTNKGLVMHETFEALTHYENYPKQAPDYVKDEKGNFVTDSKGNKIEDWGEPSLPYRVATQEVVRECFRKAMESNKLPTKCVEEFNLTLGVKRWLSFKHDYLDKRGNIIYAEKEYKEYLFGKTKTTTILDLLEDTGDGNFVIYDYKTPQSIDMNRYKTQLLVYVYMMAIVKGLIKPVEGLAKKPKSNTNKPMYEPVGVSTIGSATVGPQAYVEEEPPVRDEFKQIVDHFKCFVFFPLCKGKHEDYKKSLVELEFTAKEIQDAVSELQTCAEEVDAFNFAKPAEALQPVKMDFTCKWCNYYGAEPQLDIGFQGCPISYAAFSRNAGYISPTYTRPEGWNPPTRNFPKVGTE